MKPASRQEHTKAMQRGRKHQQSEVMSNRPGQSLQMQHTNTEGQSVRMKIAQKDHVVLGILHSTDGSTASAIARSMAITDTEWVKCHHLWPETAIPRPVQWHKT
jgi:hypothetical protein